MKCWITISWLDLGVVPCLFKLCACVWSRQSGLSRDPLCPSTTRSWGCLSLQVSQPWGHLPRWNQITLCALVYFVCRSWALSRWEGYGGKMKSKADLLALQQTFARVYFPYQLALVRVSITSPFNYLVFLPNLLPTTVASPIFVFLAITNDVSCHIAEGASIVDWYDKYGTFGCERTCCTKHGGQSWKKRRDETRRDMVFGQAAGTSAHRIWTHI